MHNSYNFKDLFSIISHLFVDTSIASIFTSRNEIINGDCRVWHSRCFIDRGRHCWFPYSLYNGFADNNEPVPSSRTRSIRCNSRSIVSNRHFFHAHNTPPCRIGRRHGEIAYEPMLRDRGGWSPAWRDREIKSNATSMPMTINEWHLDMLGCSASDCRIGLLAYLPPFLVDSINHRCSRWLLFISVISYNEINGLKYINENLY